ncbi:MAG: 4-hydroxybenzoate octaprenyltransferase [Paraperlucidibaca sp.]|uniref:4-hydroxybenzoate octaprenyltransferase n=1 Tax=Paraperlucidibaca sp. TaxID=2708021 RepID=UPI001B716968|nr:4-hydroxybenzoate octaprenyltransferase [Paraperlucidibaca sp.]MBQ0723030.1 4-hydroxybenzoate octaprenyltransferase [Paraperlucidibaca sp.]MBQ0841755.1 4-hydroxybenzoate octaprenyltransferase [Paraperlucidibaca sp.]
MISRDRLPDFIALMRLDRPIGIWLLLWPTLIALWIAGDGHPEPMIVAIFVAGVVLMRSAGCVINDYADRHIDGQVWRTADRPLASGRILGSEALMLFAALIALSATLLFWLPIQVFYWSFGALGLAVLYPFMKRVTYLPQVVLGAAFSWAIPMAFVAQGRTPDDLCWLLYAGNLAWTVAYDTQYAMADREDDLKAGVKSTAILFGDLDRVVIAGLQLIWLTALAFVGHQMQWPWPWWAGLAGVLVLFIWQWQHTASRDKHLCLAAFKHNHWVGLVLFVALLMAWLQMLALP